MNLSYNDSAATMSEDEAGAPQGTCPLMKQDIQLIPVRYALVEEEQAMPDHINASLYNEEGLSQGIRPLNEGFLYLIHSSRPDELRCYAIDKSGQLKESLLKAGETTQQETGETAIILPRSGSVKALFTPVALADGGSNFLAFESDHAKTMNAIPLAGYDPMLGDKGLISTDLLSKQTADFVTDMKPAGDAPDLGLYQWLAAEQWQLTTLSELTQFIQPDYSNDCAFMVVNDICSDIIDYASRWNSIQDKFAEEVKVRGDDYAIGTIIDQFISAQAKVSKVSQDIELVLSDGELKNLKKEELVQLIEHIEDKNNIAYRQNPVGDHPKVIPYNPVAEQYAETLANKINLSAGKLIHKVNKAIKDHNLLVDGYGPIKKGIKDVIRYDEMQTVLDKAADIDRQFKEKETAVVQMLQSIAPSWHLLAPHFSEDTPESVVARMSYEDALYQLLNIETPAWVQDYYFGDSIVPMLVYQSVSNKGQSTATLPKSLFTLANITKKIQGSANAKSKPEQLQQALNDNSDHRFKSLLTDDGQRAKVVASLANKNESMVLSLFNQTHTAQGKMIFSHKMEAIINNAPQATKAYMATFFDMTGVGWTVANTQALQQLDNKLKQLGELVAKDRHISGVLLAAKQNSAWKNKTGAARKQEKAAYDAQIKQIKTARKNNLSQIRNSLDEIQKSTFRATDGNTAMLAGVSSETARLLLNEIESTQNLFKSKTHWKETMQELTHKEGKWDNAKAQKLALGSFITVFNLYTFITAIEDYFDPEKDVELLGVVSSGFNAASASVGMVNTFYSAHLKAAYGVTGSMPVLAKLARADIAVGWVASVLGTIGYGIKFSKDRQAFLKDMDRGSVLYIVSAVKTGTSFFLLSGSFYESFHLTRIAVRVFITGTMKATAGQMAMARILAGSGPYMLWGYLLYVVIEKFYDFIKWPPLVAWANNSLWGKSVEYDTLAQNSTALNRVLFTPKISVAAEPETSASMSFEPVLTLTVILPGNELPDADNLQLALVGKRKQLTDMRLTDQLILNSEVTALKGGASKLVFDLDIRELQQRQINSLELHVSSQPWNAVSQAETYSYSIAFSIVHIAYTPTVKLTCEEISPGYSPQLSGWEVI
ncbi:toxin VasX [Photobacterium sp.]|uniref:toxin VasX n=1 Tax=Photobacterium sp. TaxID=660 RepID=UPI00299E7E1C|nr:toxin VasX [Photobacterium sp.]MDX1304662.1 toxin VasX [Photobacterium sp.]